jgi:hypothetical protein
MLMPCARSMYLLIGWLLETLDALFDALLDKRLFDLPDGLPYLRLTIV